MFDFLFALYFISPGQNVTVMLTGKYHGNPLILDSIILENLTQPSQKVLSPLTQITSYQIDIK